MAWTSPMTFADNNVLTAAQMNTHLRDNLLETAPAKATTNGGSFFVSQGPNRIEERIVKTDRKTFFETTTSSTYSDLATSGPSVQVVTGTAAIVMLASSLGNTVTGSSASMGFQISGYTSRDPQDSTSISVEGTTGNTDSTLSGTFYVTELTPGINVFTTKYKCGADSGRFNNRFIGVIPL